MKIRNILQIFVVALAASSCMSIRSRGNSGNMPRQRHNSLQKREEIKTTSDGYSIHVQRQYRNERFHVDVIGSTTPRQLVIRSFANRNYKKIYDLSNNIAYEKISFKHINTRQFQGVEILLPRKVIVEPNDEPRTGHMYQSEASHKAQTTKTSVPHITGFSHLQVCGELNENYTDEEGLIVTDEDTGQEKYIKSKTAARGFMAHGTFHSY